MGAQEAYLIPALPAAAFVVLLLFGKYLPRGGDFIAIAAIAAAFLLFFPVLADFLDKANGTDFVSAEKTWKWIQFDNFEIRLGFFVDQITIVMLAVFAASSVSFESGALRSRFHRPR